VCVGGWVSPCAVSPFVVFPPAVCGGCAPLRSSDPRVALLSWVHRLSLRASARQTWAGSSLADAGAPQLHALAPLQQRHWPAHRPAHIKGDAVTSYLVNGTFASDVRDIGAIHKRWVLGEPEGPDVLRRRAAEPGGFDGRLRDESSFLDAS